MYLALWLDIAWPEYIKRTNIDIPSKTQIFRCQTISPRLVGCVNILTSVSLFVHSLSNDIKPWVCIWCENPDLVFFLQLANSCVCVLWLEYLKLTNCPYQCPYQCDHLRELWSLVPLWIWQMGPPIVYEFLSYPVISKLTTIHWMWHFENQDRHNTDCIGQFINW